MTLRSLVCATCLVAVLGPARPGHGKPASEPDPVVARSRTTSQRSARQALTPSQRGPADPRTLLRRSAADGASAALTPEQRLIENIERIRNSRILRRGVTAIYAVDARTGAPVVVIHENEPLNPASSVKLISTAAVLDLLGGDWRYETALLAPAPGPDGVIRGDVLLRGSHDPTLSSRHLRDLASQLAGQGVREIQGDVLIGSQSERDGVQSGGIRIAVTGAARPGEPARVTVTPDCEYVEIQARARTSKRRRARIAIDSATVRVGRGGERMRISVSGQIGAGMSRVFYRVPRNRVLFTGNVLHSELARAGITVTGTVRRRTFEEYQAAAQGFAAPPRALAIHRSEPLRDLVAQVNKRSDNYLADQLITMAAAVRHRAEPSLARGVDVMKQWLERIGIPRGKIQIDTGSGLSYRTRITARQLVQVLRAASGLGAGAAGAQPVATTGKTGAPAVTGIPSYASDWLRSLAVAGRDGTLRGRFRGSAVRERMIGKTGTLTGIIALTGIVSDEDGSALCFAIVTNRGRHRQRGHIRREHEAIVEALHQYLVEKRTGVRAPLADPASAPATGEPDRAFELDESLETEAAPAAPR